MDDAKIHYWKEVDDDMVLSWSEIELILNVHHELQQSITSASAWGKALAEGRYGFTSDEQKQVIEHVQNRLERIYELDRWIRVWIQSRQKKD